MYHQGLIIHPWPFFRAWYLNQAKASVSTTVFPCSLMQYVYNFSCTTFYADQRVCLISRPTFHSSSCLVKTCIQVVNNAAYVCPTCTWSWILFLDLCGDWIPAPKRHIIAFHFCLQVNTRVLCAIVLHMNLALCAIVTSLCAIASPMCIFVLHMY